MHAVPRNRSLWRRLRSPLSGLGSGPTAWLLTNAPGAVHRMPAALRMRFVARHLPPEGAWWLRDRVDARIETLLSTTVTDARPDGDGCRLALAVDGRATARRFDHVVAGTGFRVDVDRLDYLDDGLRPRIARVDRSPRLDARFETSVPGLHMIGPASAMSFGPLFRFVVGAEHSARTLARHFARA
jgi:hypothetical protein